VELDAHDSRYGLRNSGSVLATHAARTRIRRGPFARVTTANSSRCCSY
jgi:hypothetical protein